MRIVYLLSSLGVGGAEKQALAIADRMAARGHTVRLLVLLPPLAAEWPTTIPTLYLNLRKNPWTMLDGFRRAHAFLRDFRPDLVHGHGYHANIFARLLRLATPPFVALSTVHNVYEGGRHRMLAYRVTDRLSRHTVAVSQAAANRFIRLGAVPRRKCSVILNGIDVHEFAPEGASGARIREELGVSAAAEEAEFVWLAVGRLVPNKDYPNLLRAFAEASSGRADARLWIAGDAPVGQIAALQQIVSELEIRDSVRWLGLRRDMPALLGAADAFVSGSAWEGMPLAVGEAMAMAKPVVATDVGGVRELVGDAGVIVPAKDSEALADAMTATMKKNREVLAATGRAARQRIADHFSMDAAAGRWLALYEQLIRER